MVAAGGIKGRVTKPAMEESEKHLMPGGVERYIEYPEEICSACERGKIR